VNRPEARRRVVLCLAAHLSGRAIQITRTTAPHALSYTLTADFGVPHGHAVALTLGEFIVFNSQVSETDVNDPRGAEFVRSRVAEVVRVLGGRDPEEARDRFVDLIRACGLGSRLPDVGVRDDRGLARIAAGVNVQRLANNPRRLTSGQLLQVLEAVA
jgi:alcohol dehydrogenase class IV